MFCFGTIKQDCFIILSVFLAKSYLHILASERVINPGHLQREGNWATDTNNICTEEQDATKNGTPNSQTGDTLGQGEAAEVGFEEASISFPTSPFPSG